MTDYCVDDEYFTDEGFSCFCDGGFIVTFTGVLAEIDPQECDE